MSDPNEETSTLTRVPSETEAAIVIAALDENGIRAESDEYTSGLRAGPWNWVDIMVATQDLAKRKKFSRKSKKRTTTSIGRKWMSANRKTSERSRL